MSSGAGKPTTSEAEIDHGQILVDELRTPPENDEVYGRINPDAPDVLALARDIQAHGILDPLVVTLDNFVLSGNRRLAAAKILGMDVVPCRVEAITRSSPRFIELLVAHNSQRIKRIDQVARELAVTIDPETAHRRLVESRQHDSAVNVSGLNLGAVRVRAAIGGNRPLADACIRVVNEMCDHWPLSDRQIHYLLLNDPPKLHDSKRARYANDPRSYRTLTNILTRLRLSGEIPFAAIGDETRPVTLSNTHANPQDYLRAELEAFLTNYWRDLQQSQPNHVELVVEKLTVQNTVKHIAYELTVPLTVGRGFSSIPPRYDMVQRFRKSGKDKLVVVIVSDLDPAGMTIAQSFGRSLRDDFGVEDDRLVCVKAALTKEQVDTLGLPPGGNVKLGAATAKEYIRRYGQHVWELEAVPITTLQQIVRDALLSVMDADRLNSEQRKEHEEARQLEGYRTAVLRQFEHGPISDWEARP